MTVSNDDKPRLVPASDEFSTCPHCGNIVFITWDGDLAEFDEAKTPVEKAIPLNQRRYPYPKGSIK